MARKSGSMKPDAVLIVDGQEHYRGRQVWASVFAPELAFVATGMDGRCTIQIGAASAACPPVWGETLVAVGPRTVRYCTATGTAGQTDGVLEMARVDVRLGP
jgi:hypothetical protein